MNSGPSELRTCPGHFVLRLACLVSVLLAATAARPADGDFDLARSAGGMGADAGQSVAVDSAGNVYVAGYFAETVTVETSTGSVTLTASGERDILVLQFDPAGTLVWAKGFGGTLDDRAQAITLDAMGNICLTGHFRETVDFDPDTAAGNLVAAGGSDAFVLKLDGDGAFLWAVALGGIFDDFGNAIAAGGESQVCVTGSFEGTADFDPGAGTAPLTAAGEEDAFVARLSANGELVWAKTLGGTQADAGAAIALDSENNVYTTGEYRGTADFDPAAGTANRNAAGGSDIFLSKLDAGGAFVWVSVLGSGAEDRGNGIAVGGGDSPYITGYFSGTVELGGGERLMSAGGTDIFVLRFNGEGTLTWARSMGGLFEERGSSIAVDASGNVYTTGSFDGPADLDPGSGLLNVTPTGVSDIFALKLDPDGALVWARSTGGPAANEGLGIAVDGASNVYSTGYFSGTADFDPGMGTYSLTAEDGVDLFVLKLFGPDLVAPHATVVRAATEGPTNADTVLFTVVFDEHVQNLGRRQNLWVKMA